MDILKRADHISFPDFLKEEIESARDTMSRVSDPDTSDRKYRYT